MVGCRSTELNRFSGSLKLLSAKRYSDTVHCVAVCMGSVVDCSFPAFQSVAHLNVEFGPGVGMCSCLHVHPQYSNRHVHTYIYIRSYNIISILINYGYNNYMYIYILITCV